MAQDNCQKIKLLKLYELLRQETDEQHPMTTMTIIDRLNKIGISCERRTLAKDMWNRAVLPMTRESKSYFSKKHCLPVGTALALRR